MTFSNWNAVSGGEAWIAENELYSESEGRWGYRTALIAQEKKDAKKSKKSWGFWPFNQDSEPKLNVLGPVKELLDRVIWTLQTGHCATGIACCDRCCDSTNTRVVDD